MPGRKQTPVHTLFTIVGSDNYKGKRAVCKFCFNEVSNNGTRKEKHILECMQCTDDIKLQFLGKRAHKTNKRKKKYHEKPTSVPEKRAKTQKIQSCLDVVTLSDSDQSDDAVHKVDDNPSTMSTTTVPSEESHQLDPPGNEQETSPTVAFSGADKGSSTIAARTPARLAPIFRCGENSKSTRSQQQMTPVQGTPRLPKKQFHSKMRTQANPKLCVDRMSTFQNVSMIVAYYNS